MSGRICSSAGLTKTSPAIESYQEVGEGADGAPVSEFADEGDAPAVQGAFTMDGVEIQERLPGVLAILAVSGIDNGPLEASVARSAARRVVS